MTRVTFQFDDRSIMPMDDLVKRGQDFTEITVRDPATGDERKLVIPKLDETRCPHCGERMCK